MKQIKKNLSWLSQKGNKLFIHTKNPVVVEEERQIWKSFCSKAVDMAFAIKKKDINFVLKNIADTFVIKDSYNDLKMLSNFVSIQNVKIEQIENNTYFIYHENGEWCKIQKEENFYSINFFSNTDYHIFSERKNCLGEILKFLHNYLNEEEEEEEDLDGVSEDQSSLPQFHSQSEWDAYVANQGINPYEEEVDEEERKGIIKWCEEAEGVAIKSAGPDYIIIINKQYVYKLKTYNNNENSLFLMPHSKQEDLVKVGNDEKIIEYLDELLSCIERKIK